MCDKSHEAIKFVIANVKKTKLEENAIIINKDYTQFLKDAEKNGIKFDIIFLDPPYKTNFIEKSIEKITTNNILNESGIIVCESSMLDKIIYSNAYTAIKEKKYGDKYVVILKKV